MLSLSAPSEVQARAVRGPDARSRVASALEHRSAPSAAEVRAAARNVSASVSTIVPVHTFLRSVPGHVPGATVVAQQAHAYAAEALESSAAAPMTDYQWLPSLSDASGVQ